LTALLAAGPPRGQLFDVDGFRLHLQCAGEGPTVVLEAAMWEAGLTWSLMQPAVSEFARACTYDRAGLGWSESSTRPRTAGDMAEEHRAVLTAGGVRGPYDLVAHSSSGILARLFAHRHPEYVAGRVLVPGIHILRAHSHSSWEPLSGPRSIRNASYRRSLAPR